ncbi:MAG: hypothetical protein EKK55_06985 [Rhodocyclaceae bacterium]|nr:MAG: hypothetical protein EKK55_06985 [Rhodocyclaceae bacterium]
MKPGDAVGAERWPYQGAHPDCWGPPWRGTLLAVDDPRVWAPTLAVYGQEPTPAAIAEHLGRWPSRPTSVPVLWDFGPHGEVIHWERPARLRSYADDAAAWRAARAAAYASWACCPAAA